MSMNARSYVPYALWPLEMVWAVLYFSLFG